MSSAPAEAPRDHDVPVAVRFTRLVEARPDPVAYMSEVARTPAAVAYKSHVLSQLSLAPGLRAVDVGCGPGTDLLQAAELVAPGGLVVGLDVDRGMLDAAAAAGSGARLLAADAHALPLAAGSVDRLRADRALQHLEAPSVALEEFLRVLVPGGIAVLAEPDWRTLVIDGGREEVSRRFVDYTCEQVVRNATVGRELARLGEDAGFTPTGVTGFSTVMRDFPQADRIFGLTRNARAATRAGYLSSDQADEWLDRLSRGPVLAAVTLFVTTLVAPRR